MKKIVLFAAGTVSGLGACATKPPTEELAAARAVVAQALVARGVERAAASIPAAIARPFRSHPTTPRRAGGSIGEWKSSSTLPNAS
jgi:hypothetical protein